MTLIDFSDHGLKIVEVKAFPTSFRVMPEDRMRLGIGCVVKRDAVVVKVVTDGGLTGYGESHHARAPGSIAHLINTTLRQLVIGMSAADVVGVWATVYQKQLASHGMGAAACMGLSGIDMALWDIRSKSVGWPLFKLLGGSHKAIPAYAGGVALGYQDPQTLVEEATPHVKAGYRALKLRVGDTPARDIERVAALRNALGDDVVLLTDANTAYSLEDANLVMPRLQSLGVSWLEEPFPPHDYWSYVRASRFSTLPLAAGENHYTRYEFSRLLDDGAITVLQPDLSKAGGITEGLRIAGMASAHNLRINPHSSMTGINMAASVHFLAAIDNSGYFEGDISRNNHFRDSLTSPPYVVGEDGCVLPLLKPGIGVEVNEEFLEKHPVIEGPSYV